MMERFLGAARRVTRTPPRRLVRIAVRRVAARIGTEDLDLPLQDEYVWDSSRPLPPASPAGDAPRRIGWIVVPPSPGSGGHTTFFRMVAAAQQAGHHCTVLFYDPYSGDFAANVARVRRGWPWLDCDIRDVTGPLDDLDVFVASAWQTSHVLAARTAHRSVARFALLQDYEPDFHPRGSLRAFAEDAYRLGIENVALGGMVADRLHRELGVASRVIPYGTDRTVYSRRGEARSGIAFFAKTGNDRRGYRLGVLALREFQRMAPEVPIHVYGDRMREAGVTVRNHGYLTPPELDLLYNRVRAGLVLSFTNPSLIPAEMAASGAVPVVNELVGAREVLDNPHIRWAAPTPTALARELVAAAQEDGPERSAAVASWSTPTWDDTAAALLDVITGSPARQRTGP